MKKRNGWRIEEPKVLVCSCGCKLFEPVVGIVAMQDDGLYNFAGFLEFFKCANCGKMFNRAGNETSPV